MNALRAVFLLLVLGFVACGTGSEPDPDSGSDAGTPDAASAMDAGADHDAATELDAPETVGEFELGTNPAFEATPEDFTAIVDGEEVPLTFGVQGSWMVVLAFRTRDALEGMLDVRGAITVDGVEAGMLWLELQETFPGGDGWDYYYNFFLAIDHKPDQGTPARIVMTVTDENGHVVEAVHDVLIGAEVD